MIEEIVIKALKNGIQSIAGNTEDTNKNIQNLVSVMEKSISGKKSKSYLVPVCISTVVIVVVIIGTLFFTKKIVSYDPNIVIKLEEISKKFDMLDPKIPKMCAMHGYYMNDEKHTDKKGFRMVRVDRKGFLISKTSKDIIYNETLSEPKKKPVLRR